MRVAIRADANEIIGSGHVARTLALIQRLKQFTEVEARLFSNALPANITQNLAKENVSHTKLDEPNYTGTDIEIIRDHSRGYGEIDLLVVDSYTLDAEWETGVKPFVRKILVIDDLANRPHNCDFLIDPSLNSKKSDLYTGLVSNECRIWLGPTYFPLRLEFDRPARIRENKVSRILISLGGAPSISLIQQLDKILFNLDPLKEIEIRLLPGINQAALELNQLKKIRLVPQDALVQEMMNWADLCIGSGGGESWERCSNGLPALAMMTAENQRENIGSLVEIGAVKAIGNAANLNSELLTEELLNMVSGYGDLAAMSKKAAQVMDGRMVSWGDLVRDLIGSLTKDQVR